MKNNKVIASSVLALAFMYLTFTIHWMFIAIAALLSWWGWRELMKK